MAQYLIIEPVPQSKRKQSLFPSSTKTLTADWLIMGMHVVPMNVMRISSAPTLSDPGVYGGKSANREFSCAGSFFASAELSELQPMMLLPSATAPTVTPESFNMSLLEIGAMLPSLSVVRFHFHPHKLNTATRNAAPPRFSKLP
jgi:hypothetical protein